MKIFLIAVIFSLAIVGTSAAEPVPSYSDLWDISQGASVTGSSPILDHGGSFVSDARNMFGGNFGTLGGSTVFEDFSQRSDGTAQWITWSTSTPVTVGSLNLFGAAYSDQQRLFSSFKLYADGNLICDFTPTTSFDGIYSATITPITAQNFRAEFGPSDIGGYWASSAVITELDGFAPTAVPEPATMSLLGLGLMGLLKLRKKRI